MRFFALGILSSLTLVLTACGDDGKEPTSTATNTTPAGPTSDPTATDSNGTTTGEPQTGTTDDTPTTDTPTSTTGTTEPATSTTDPGTSTDPGTTTGTTTDPGTTTEPGTTGGGIPVGEDYGPCNNEKMIACTNTMYCLDPAAVMGLKGSFCSPECSGPGNICPKPDGLSMKVQALCAFDTDMDMNPDICALICNLDDDACPEGTTCEDIGIPPMGNPPVNFGVCSNPLP